jgi:ribokinase
MPALLQPVVERITWFGPVIAPEDLPRLEIAHHGAGRATLVNASWGAEWRLTPQDLPSVMHQAACVHSAALSTAQRQLAFVQALRTTRGNRDTPRISVGTYARLVYGETETVRQLLRAADIFFMNANEAAGLFGSVAQARTRSEALLFVTLGAEGACVIAGEQVMRIPGQNVTELDPTGAGDTFCGATLAGMVLGALPVAAAEHAVLLAASTVSAVGPAVLLG